MSIVFDCKQMGTFQSPLIGHLESIKNRLIDHVFKDDSLHAKQPTITLAMQKDFQTHVLLLYSGLVIRTYDSMIISDGDKRAFFLQQAKINFIESQTYIFNISQFQTVTLNNSSGKNRFSADKEDTYQSYQTFIEKNKVNFSDRNSWDVFPPNVEIHNLYYHQAAKLVLIFYFNKYKYKNLFIEARNYFPSDVSLDILIGKEMKERMK